MGMSAPFIRLGTATPSCSAQDLPDLHAEKMCCPKLQGCGDDMQQGRTNVEAQELFWVEPGIHAGHHCLQNNQGSQLMLRARFRMSYRPYQMFKQGLLHFGPPLPQNILPAFIHHHDTQFKLWRLVPSIVVSETS